MTSGLTTGYVRPDPVTFGSERQQQLLIEIAQLGEVRMKRRHKGYYKRLAEIGLCVLRYEPGRDVLTLDVRHPAVSEILALLTELSGVPVVTAAAGEGVGVVHPTMPLGHVSPVDFRVLVVIAHAGERLDEQTIRRRIPDHWPSSVTSAIDRLVKNRVLDLGVVGFAFASDAPQSLSALVLRLADVIGDERLKPSDTAGPRAFAFNQAADGAPRLFGRCSTPESDGLGGERTDAVCRLAQGHRRVPSP